MAPPDAARRAYIVTDAMIEAVDWNRHQVPAYKTEECARFFFAKTVHWLRRYLRRDADHPLTWFVFNGAEMDFRRTNPATSSARVFWLSDIEKMAWSLYDFGVIDEQSLYRTLRVVESQAFLFGLFDDVEQPRPATTRRGAA